MFAFICIFINMTSDQKTDNLNEPTVSYDKLYTYADYLKFDFDYMVELIKGRLYKMSPAPHPNHQKISLGLTLSLGTYLEDKPCQLFHAPLDVILPIKNKKLDSVTTVVQPDLCIICDLEKITDAGCVGAPDLVIEILSPSTAKKDMKDKYEIYEEAGVKEYWIVSLDYKYVQVFLLEDSRYGRAQIYNHEDIVSPSMFPDLEVDLSRVLTIK